MALGRAHSVAVSGVDGQIVEIEADIGRGLPAVHLVGLPDAALHESRDRIRAAVTNSGEEWPDSKVILALSPATLPKVGSVYDLALSLSVLDAAKKLPRKLLRETVFLGELALDGRLRSVRGVLPAVLAAKRAGWGTVVVPARALAEAGLVKGIEVLGADDLSAVIGWLRGELALAVPDVFERAGVVVVRDLSEVVGQTDARWSIEVAAAGTGISIIRSGRIPGALCSGLSFRGGRTPRNLSLRSAPAWMLVMGESDAADTKCRFSTETGLLR